MSISAESSGSDSVTLSVVVPVYNERDSLVQLVDELQAGVRSSVSSYEIIFVDDGSTDDSWKKIEELASREAVVSGIRLRRNFGKAAALTAGMKVATGDLILMLDADLQDDPAEFLLWLRPGPGRWSTPGCQGRPRRRATGSRSRGSLDLKDGHGHGGLGVESCPAVGHGVSRCVSSHRDLP